MQNFICKKFNSLKKALTLTEVCIAVALLALAFGSIVVFYRNATLETSFTSEHFTAMFLAQKVLEDINSRVKIDPYFYTELIQNASGKEEPVVGNNCSKYFRLIENTKNFSSLSLEDDEPISSGELYEQLKNFTVQVSSSFVENPSTNQPYENLLKIDIFIRWPTKGSNIKREYKLSQYLYGINDSLYQTFPKIKLSEVEKAQIEQGSLEYLAYLFGYPKESFSLSLLQTKFDDSLLQDLLDLGLIGYILKLGLEVEDKYKSKIESLEHVQNLYKNKQEISDKLKNLDLQISIANLYEEKAFQLIHLLLCIKEPLENLLNSLSKKSDYIARISQNTRRTSTYLKNYSNYSTNSYGRLMPTSQITNEHSKSSSNTTNTNNTDNASLLNNNYYNLSNIFDNKEYYEKYSDTLNNIFFILRFIPTSLSTVEDLYLKIMKPPFIELLSGGKEVDIIKKFIDIQKIAVLRTLNDSEANKLLVSYRNSLETILKRFHGKFPIMVDYVEKEIKIAKNLSTIRNKFLGIYLLFKYLDNCDEKIVQLKNILPPPSDKPEDKNNKR